MIKHIIILLILLNLNTFSLIFAMKPNEKITFLSSDDRKVTVKVKYVQQSLVLKELLENMSNYEEGGKLPVLYKIFNEYVIPAMKALSNDQETQSSTNFTAFEENSLWKSDYSIIQNIIGTANYLNIPKLLESSLKIFPNIFSSKIKTLIDDPSQDLPEESNILVGALKKDIVEKKLPWFLPLTTKTFTSCYNSIRNVCFSSDGTYLVSSHSDGDISAFNLQDETVIDYTRVYNNWKYTPQELFSSKKGNYFAYSAYEHGIQIGQFNSNKFKKLIYRYHSIYNNFSKICFSSNNNYIAGSREDSVVVWDLNLSDFRLDENKNIIIEPDENKDIIIESDIESENGMIISICFSPDEKNIAVCYGKKIEIWNLTTKKVIKTINLKTYISWDPHLNFLYSPNQEYLGIIDNSYLSSRKIQLYKESSEKETPNVIFNGSNFDFSPNGNYIAIANGNNVEIYNINGFKEKDCLRCIKTDNKISCLAFSYDGNMIATAANDKNDKTVKLWMVNPRSFFNSHSQQLLLSQVMSAALIVQYYEKNKKPYPLEKGSNKEKVFNLLPQSIKELLANKYIITQSTEKKSQSNIEIINLLLQSLKTKLMELLKIIQTL